MVCILNGFAAFGDSDIKDAKIDSMGMKEARFGLIIFLTLGVLGEALAASETDILNRKDSLPFGVFPPISQVLSEEAPDDLPGDIKHLNNQVEDAVKTFASRRNLNCIKTPCLLQAFPILYHHKRTGFFGGVHANLRDSLRSDPPYFSLTGHFIRSDTDQWITYINLDLPKIDFLPFEPRFKIGGHFNRNTENQYFGLGTDSNSSRSRDDSELRFGLEEYSLESALIVSVMNFEGNGELSVFGAVNANQIRISKFDEAKSSKLYEDSPLGINGGASSNVGVGILADTRDREVMSTHGWALEMAAAIGGSVFGNFDYQRFTVIDRRYFTAGRSTFALRTTLDSIQGDVPFWELENTGGIDPIRNVSGSGILRNYTSGRFHEKVKAIESTEYRYRLAPKHFWGQYSEVTFIPLGIDIGRMGPLWAISASTGIDVLLNRSFLINVLLGYAETGVALNLNFNQDY